MDIIMEHKSYIVKFLYYDWYSYRLIAFKRSVLSPCPLPPAKKPPHRYAAGGSVLLREFFFYFFERHFKRMPA